MTRLANDVLQLLEVDHHPGLGIDLAADAHFDGVIVTVAAGVVALVVVRRFQSASYFGLLRRCAAEKVSLAVTIMVTASRLQVRCAPSFCCATSLLTETLKIGLALQVGEQRIRRGCSWQSALFALDGFLSASSTPGESPLITATFGDRRPVVISRLDAGEEPP